MVFDAVCKAVHEQLPVDDWRTPQFCGIVAALEKQRLRRHLPKYSDVVARRLNSLAAPAGQQSPAFQLSGIR